MDGTGEDAECDPSDPDTEDLKFGAAGGFDLLSEG